MSDTPETDNTTAKETIDTGWKRRNYAIGALSGAVFGFMSAYMFTQEAEKSAQDDERPEIAPTTMITLALSVLGLVRQIAESGKKKKKG